MPAIIALDNVTVSHARESFTQQQRMFAKMGLSYRKKSSIMGTSLHPGHTALRKGRVSIANTAYLVTATTFDRVNHFEYFAAACAAARCFENVAVLRDNRLLAWVLMPDHAHWLIQLGEADTLSSVVNRLKSASARSANRVLGRNGTLWARTFHDHALRQDEDIQHVARYIIANPPRAGLVKRVGDYSFWNAVWI